ncbi:MAG: glycosyltransferase, partial [Pyrinomonadaceae bacterium]
PIYLAEMSRELSIKDIISVFKIYRLISREKPDIIHTHTAKAGTIGRIAAFIYRWLAWRMPRQVRTVHTFHGHVFHSYYGKLKTRCFLIIEKQLARFATDKIVVISPQQFQEINGDFGVGRREQFSVIPLGIDLTAFGGDTLDRQEFRAEIGARDSDIVVGFVGRLTEIKDVPHLLSVAAMYNNLPAAAKPSIKFVIIGDGHLRERLQEQAEQMGISRTITFLGNRHDAAKCYAGLDVVALTSANEGTPLSLIEAMASERAVISTVVGGVVDLLGIVHETMDGFQIRERGIGVDSRSTDAYLNGLIRLASDRDLRKKFGRAGSVFVRERYSKERLVKDIKNLYRELV